MIEPHNMSIQLHVQDIHSVINYGMLLRTLLNAKVIGNIYV